MNYDRSEILKEGSWLDNFAGDAVVAKNLDSIYADDVLQAVNEDHASLDEALASLKARTGLTTAETVEIKRVVTAKLKPRVALAEKNIKKLSKVKLGELIKLATTECKKCENVPCDCNSVMSKDVAEAVSNIGLEAIAEMYDTASGNLCDKCGKIANFCGCSKGESKDDDDESGEEKEEVKDDEKEEKESSAKGKVKTADDHGEHGEDEEDDQAKRRNDQEKRRKGKESKASAGDGCGCGGKKTATAADAREDTEDDDDEDEDEEAGETQESSAKGKVTTAKKKAKKKKKVSKKKWDKKKVKVKNKKKCSAWENFLEKKGYFQGADTAPMDPNTSNDPTALGYPGEVEYQQAPMATPVGEDSRPWEQKWFEGAANETKKEFLPGGTDLAIKKEWQRASYKAYMQRHAEASKFAGFDKNSNPYEFLKKMKKIKTGLQKEQEIATQPVDPNAPKDPMAATMGIDASFKKKVTRKNS